MKTIYGLICALFLSATLWAEKIEVLTPPRISPETVLQKVACTRPMREGRFKISCEKQDEKIIMHCYGHGGSGCTTSFGSVRKAIELFENQYGHLPKTPIRVIGCGYIGMTAAIELSLKGYEVAGITAKELYDIPSWKNAGYFALVSVKTDPEEQENLNKIGMETFLEYKNIHEGKHPYIGPECVRYMPVYSSEDTDAGVEDLEARGLIPPKEYVTLDFGNGVMHPHFVKYMTYFMDTTNIMLQLKKTVDRLGIKVEQKKLNSFNEVSESVIFNCSGLGAKQLNSDSHMIAVRGHLLNLSPEAGEEHMNYMIYTKVKGSGDKPAYVYLFPKALQVTCDKIEGTVVAGTLGGTFIPNTDLLNKEELEVLDKKEFDELYKRNLEFFGPALKPKMDT